MKIFQKGLKSFSDPKWADDKQTSPKCQNTTRRVENSNLDRTHCNQVAIQKRKNTLVVRSGKDLRRLKRICKEYKY